MGVKKALLLNEKLKYSKHTEASGCEIQQKLFMLKYPGIWKTVYEFET